MSNKMYRKALVLSVLIVAAAVAIVYAMGRAPAPQQKQVKAIDFTLTDINGKTHTLSDYKGKLVFLNFWATWCPPCLSEMPAMQKLYQTWDKDMFVMLAVNMGQSRAEVKAFAKKHKYTFPILMDSEQKVAAGYRVRGIPTTYFIDAKGNIIGRVVGAREWTLEDVQGLIK